ncbi:MAG TPA: ABC transporter substrate-binding protein, partial [Acidimicrobiia bacterium]|nr:ABC transporter substrate-binding protein [Acidimicrobiia bacterium]
MFKARNLAIACLVIVGLTVPAIGTASAQSSDEKPKATEVGVTATEIHIGVVADVDNPFAPGLFQGAVDGVKAGAAYLNSKAGGGGLAGRKVVVDFYDSKLNGNESRNATIQGCQNDYALVGTSALFLTQVEDIVNCPDKAGAATGIPDLSAVTTGVPESCSPMAFPAYGTALDCPSVSQNPQTYYANQGPAKWELSKNKDLHGVTIVGIDTKDAARGGTILGLAAQQAGIKLDQGDPVVGVSGRDPQSVFTPIVQRMKNDNSNWSLNVGAANQALLIRSEAEVQGLDTSKILWECVSCYGNEIVPKNADAFEGEVQFLGFLPFEEASVNKTVANFLKYMKQVGGTPDQFSA